MKMMEAEQEALRLCPGTTVFLSYERKHVVYYPGNSTEKGFSIECRLWVDSLKEHFRGPNWNTVINGLRDRLHLNPPQTCPDQEIQALPAA
jgi:hypothetical protein